MGSIYLNVNLFKEFLDFKNSLGLLPKKYYCFTCTAKLMFCYIYKVVYKCPQYNFEL